MDVPKNNPELQILKAQGKDAQKLTELTLRSKDYWGYGAAQIESWKEELTITEAYILENEVYKLVTGNDLIGFYAFLPENNRKVKLNFLFIEPDYIGHGYGKLLLTNFLQRVMNMGYGKVTLDADPFAKSFYARNGFEVVGQLQSTIKDRFLPIMELQLPTKNL